MKDFAFGSPADQLNRASVNEGKALARLFGSENPGAGEQVQQRLLQDAYLAKQGEFNFDTVKNTLIEQVNKLQKPGVELKQDKAGNVSQKGYVLPVVGWELGGKAIYDQKEAEKILFAMN